MKRLAFYILIFAFLGGTVSTLAQQYRQDDHDGGYGQRYDGRHDHRRDVGPHPRDGACFYTTAPFRGQRFCMRVGERLPNLPNNFGDNISSIEVFGNARVRIFNDSDYRNGSFEVWRSVPDLRQLPFRDGHTWNNRVSSIMVSFSGGSAGPYGPPNRDDRDRGNGPRNNRWDNGPGPRNGACFYMTSPYRGHRFCMRVGDRLPNLPNGYGDNISSIEVFGNARVRIFNDSYFRNGSFEVWRSVPDLRALPFRDGHTWNNRVSSIIVY